MAKRRKQRVNKRNVYDALETQIAQFVVGPIIARLMRPESITPETIPAVRQLFCQHVGGTVSDIVFRRWLTILNVGNAATGGDSKKYEGPSNPNPGATIGPVWRKMPDGSDAPPQLTDADLDDGKDPPTDQDTLRPGGVGSDGAPDGPIPITAPVSSPLARRLLEADRDQIGKSATAAGGGRLPI